MLPGDSGRLTFDGLVSVTINRLFRADVQATIEPRHQGRYMRPKSIVYISLFLFLAAVRCRATDTITAGHPRLWLTPAMITNIHNHVLANDTVWRNFATYADDIYGGTASYYLLTEAAMYVALHNIPGDSSDGANYDPAHHTSAQWASVTITAFLSSANSDINMMCGSYGVGPTLSGCTGASAPVSPVAGNEGKNNGEKYALAYDWLQYGTDQWGSNKAFANQFLAAMASGLQGMGLGGAASGQCLESTGGAIIPDDNECLGGMMMAQTLAALAIYGDGLNPLDNQDRNGNPAIGTNQQFDWAMNDPTFGWRNLFAPFVNTGIGVGAPKAEGASYGYGDYAYAIRALLGIDTGSNANFFATIPNWLNEATSWMIHATTPASDLLNGTVTTYPAFYYMLPFGDQSAFFMPNEDGRAAMLMYAYQLGASLQGQYVRDWINNKFPTWPPATVLYYTAYDLLFGNFPSSTTASYTTPTNYWTDSRCTLPTSGCGLNFVSSRSDWTSNATWLTFRAGTPEVRHGREDTGNLTFYRKGKWLVLGPPQYGPPWTSAELQSVLTYQGANDHNSSGTYVWKGPQQQTVVSGNVTTDLAYENPPGDPYTYSRAEIGRAYQSTSLPSVFGDFVNAQRVERQVVHVKPDYVIVHDRTVWRDPTQTKFQLQLMTDTSTPTNSSRVITSTNGTQKLFLTALLPGSPTINIVNLNTSGSVFDGPYTNNLVNYGAYGSGCNGVSPACLNSFGNNTGPSTIAYYRAEVITPSQATSQVMLNLFQGADSSASPTPAVAITSGNYAGAHVQDAAANWVVGFSNLAAGTALSLPVTYSYSPTTSLSYHLLTDLPPSTPVCVSDTSNTIAVQTCGTGTSMTTSSQGTLAFRDTSGVLVQINNGVAAPPPSPCDVNQDGVVNSLDITAAISQALNLAIGIPGACTTADLKKDGHCDVRDVQVVINATLNGACTP